MTITLTGSLGHIGRPLTNELMQQGHTVTVISSSSERQTEIEALGARAAVGSVENVDFVVSTFTSADAVFVMIPPNFSKPDQVAYYSNIANNYAQAVQQSDISRVVHLSSYGAHLDKETGFILGSHHAENILDDLTDVNLTHLRPGYFYQNLFGFINMIENKGFMRANYGGDDKVVLVHPKDIAAVAAEELTSPTGNAIRYIASDECTANDIAAVLGKAIGKPSLKWQTLTDEQMRDGLEANDMPHHVAANFVELGAALHSGTLLEDYEQHTPVNMGSVKLEDFAEEFAKVYHNEV